MSKIAVIDEEYVKPREEERQKVQCFRLCVHDIGPFPKISDYSKRTIHLLQRNFTKVAKCRYLSSKTSDHDRMEILRAVAAIDLFSNQDFDEMLLKITFGTESDVKRFFTQLYNLALGKLNKQRALHILLYFMPLFSRSKVIHFRSFEIQGYFYPFADYEYVERLKRELHLQISGNDWTHHWRVYWAGSISSIWRQKYSMDLIKNVYPILYEGILCVHRTFGKAFDDQKIPLDYNILDMFVKKMIIVFVLNQ